MKSMTMVLGYTCNNNCIFCIFGDQKHKGIRKSAEVKKRLKDMRKQTSSINFTGGDLTIRKDFFDILDFVKQLNFSDVSIETNGRMFSSRIFTKRVLAIFPNMRFSISVYHINPEIHDSVTRVKGSWDQTVNGIKNIISHENNNITIAFVVGKFNYKILPSAVDFFSDLGVQILDFILIRKEGAAKDNFDDIGVRISKVVPYLTKAFDKLDKTNLTVRSYGFPFCTLKGYERHVQELGLIEATLEGRKSIFDFDDHIQDQFRERLRGRRSKFKKCMNCKYYNICEGVWTHYVETFGKDEFNPVRGEKIQTKNELEKLLKNSR